MSSEVFLDTGAWVAVMVPRDAYHQAATDVYRQLLGHARALVTTNLVMAEAYIIIRRASGHSPAVRFLQALRQTSRLVKVYSDLALEQQAEEILARYADQDISFVDAVSFAAMRQRKISEAFAFDHHFHTAGFTLVPSPA